MRILVLTALLSLAGSFQHAPPGVRSSPPHTPQVVSLEPELDMLRAVAALRGCGRARLRAWTIFICSIVIEY